MKDLDIVNATCIALAATAFSVGCSGNGSDSTAEAATPAVARASDADAGDSASVARDGKTATTAEPLTPADFMLGSFSTLVDTATVLFEFGLPDTVIRLPYPADRVSVWRYEGLGITFGDDGELLRFGISGGQYTTARGLRVGDTRERVWVLYGEPSSTAPRSSGSLIYTDDLRPHRTEVATHEIIVNLRDGVVQSIHVGWVIVG